MVINGLRQEKDWSQEKLAEISGLSLRTIQRIEGSDSVSPDSLGALAAAFDMEFATLEKELAMDKTTNEWKKRPAWVRGLFFGSGRVRMDKRQHQALEFLAVSAGVLFLIVGILGVFGYLIRETAIIPLVLSGSLLILAAYLMSVVVRVGDAHAVWPWMDSEAETD